MRTLERDLIMLACVTVLLMFVAARHRVELSELQDRVEQLEAAVHTARVESIERERYGTTMRAPIAAATITRASAWGVE